MGVKFKKKNTLTYSSIQQKLSIANQELQRQLEVLRQNPFEAKNQALRHEMEGLYDQLREANQHLVDYNSTRENMQNFRKKMQN